MNIRSTFLFLAALGLTTSAPGCPGGGSSDGAEGGWNRDATDWRLDVQEDSTPPCEALQFCTADGLEQCGDLDDGCGGILDCGACPDGLLCTTEGEEANTCVTPPCGRDACFAFEMECGKVLDGCNDFIECGPCPNGMTCQITSCIMVAGGPDSCRLQCGGRAENCECNTACLLNGDCCEDFLDECPSCATACDDKQCGADGCGGSCGECAPDELCTFHQCAPCAPDCEGKACGSNGCSGTCGECPEGEACNEGECLACIPNCEGKPCGPDGCGGSCGDCDPVCANLPTGPLPMNVLPGVIASEDLDINAEGQLVGSNDKTIFLNTYEGSNTILVPNINFRAGMRFIPGGDLIVNKDTTGQVVRVEPDGTIHTLVNGLSYPNGMTVDMEGFVYVTDQGTNKILRIDPIAAEYEVISTDVGSPNGLTFSVDYKLLFVAGFNGDPTVYALPVESPGVFGKAFAYATKVGTGALDGMGVDICGNLYVADYGASRLLRIPPGGGDTHEVVIENGGYMPNFQWGQGIGGWDPLTIYVPEGWAKKVREVYLGVPSKPVPIP